MAVFPTDAAQRACPGYVVLWVGACWGCWQGQGSVRGGSGRAGGTGHPQGASALAGPAGHLPGVAHVGHNERTGTMSGTLGAPDEAFRGKTSLESL